MITPNIVSFRVRPQYTISLEFADGIAGEVDLSTELFGEVFEPLRDPDYFRMARLNEELNTICWPNGADLAPEYLYGRCLQGVKAA